MQGEGGLGLIHPSGRTQIDGEGHVPRSVVHNLLPVEVYGGLAEDAIEAEPHRPAWTPENGSTDRVLVTILKCFSSVLIVFQGIFGVLINV